MKKGIQYFSEEYVKSCKGATPDQILEFLENYRELIANTQDFLEDCRRKQQAFSKYDDPAAQEPGS